MSQSRKQLMTDTARRYPVTLAVLLLTFIGFIAFKPSAIEQFQSLATEQSPVFYPLKVIFGAFLHLDAAHWVFNVFIWGFLGSYLEPKLGSKTLFIATLFAMITGGLLETVFFNYKFIGLSSACYGLIGLLIWMKISEGNGIVGILRGSAFLILFAIADTALNMIASPNNIAYAAHIGGLMAGFLSSLGFGKGAGADEPHRVFRPMSESDIKPILEIIYDHDDDDGEEAEEAFSRSLSDKYVMEFEGRVMGMTGFRADDYSPHTAWLSFTYIHDYFRQKGNAYWMMLELRNVLEAQGIKRLFIATSDYEDEETGDDIYLPARNFYEYKLNAERELRVDNYYAPGESKYIYSLPVTSEIEETPASLPENHTARFVGLDEADESDTSYVALWEELAPDNDEPKSKLPTKSFAEMIDEVKSYNGKALFVTLPNYISIHHASELEAAGFKKLGTLSDYFGPGIDEVYWGLYFD
jgi:membrane associated rhomboid family serine protease